MFIPGLFKETNMESVRQFIRDNSFGILISTIGGKPWATHIPLILMLDAEGREFLSGHISKANPQWKEFINNPEVLVVFPGSHSYISSSWYDHENVPTWNYLAVHVYGSLQTVEGDELKAHLAAMVHTYEASMPHPVAVERMSESYIRREMKGIVGFSITITEIQAAEKLSQNRDDTNYRHIIEGLEYQGDPDSVNMAAIMKRKRPLP
jgi:transcriptional regulator